MLLTHPLSDFSKKLKFDFYVYFTSYNFTITFYADDDDDNIYQKVATKLLLLVFITLMFININYFI